MIKNVDYKSFFSKLSSDDKVIIAGGDGTLNRFINDTEGIKFENEILYYPIGTGNDFAHDFPPYCYEKIDNRRLMST